MENPSKRQWKLFILMGSTASGVLLGITMWALSAGMALLAALAGGTFGSLLFAALALANYKLISADSHRFHIVDVVRGVRDELRAMTNMRPMIDDELLLQYGGWAMNAHLAYSVIKVIREKRPRVIVECGSGSSTALIASQLQELGGERYVVALEHEPQYAETTRKLLSQHGLSDYAKVVTAPLSARQIEEEKLTWYDFNPDELLSKKSIDLLFVDGPPHTSGPMARYPAVPILRKYLSDDCIIMLDDSYRDDEQKAAQQWAEELGAELKQTGGPKGTSIVRCSTATV